MKFLPIVALAAVATAELHTFEKRDVCKKTAACVGKPSDTAATYAAFKGFANENKNACLDISQTFFNDLTANNYRLADEAIHGGKVVNISVPFIYQKTRYYVNGQVELVPGKSKTNACGTGTGPTFAQLATNGFNQFCLQAQTLAASAASTRFDAFDALSNAATKVNGPDLVGRFYAAADKAVHGKPCTANGITL